MLPNGPRDSRTLGDRERARRSSRSARSSPSRCPPGRLILQTLRSHDQFNTTVYSLNDRYRGIRKGRDVVFVHPDDLAERGLADGDRVDVVSEWPGEPDRVLRDQRVVAYPTARGCAAAYFPEANVLVPLGSTALGSNTPVSKAVIVRLEPVGLSVSRGRGPRRAIRLAQPATARASGEVAPNRCLRRRQRLGERTPWKPSSGPSTPSVSVSYQTRPDVLPREAAELDGRERERPVRDAGVQVHAAVVVVGVDVVAHVPGLRVAAEHVVVVGGAGLEHRAERAALHRGGEDALADEPRRGRGVLPHGVLLDERAEHVGDVLVERARLVLVAQPRRASVTPCVELVADDAERAP